MHHLDGSFANLLHLRCNPHWPLLTNATSLLVGHHLICKVAIHIGSERPMQLSSHADMIIHAVVATHIGPREANATLQSDHLDLPYPLTVATHIGPKRPMHPIMIIMNLQCYTTVAL